jgi:hypothetical protein
VVIKQINIGDVVGLKAENDPSVGADGDTPAAGEVTSQRVQPPTRQVEMSRLRRLIKPRQHPCDLIGVLRINLTAVVIFIKAFETPMAKSSDHSSMVV